MFINLVKKSFSDVIKNPIVPLFLVLYFMIISLLLGCINYQKNIIIVCVLFLTAFLFIAIFISGWLRIFKEIFLQKPDEPRTRSYIGMFLESVGENIIPMFIGLVLYILFSLIFMAAAYFVAIKSFGNLQSLIPDIQNATGVMDLANLPPEKLNMLYGWQLCFSGFGCIFMLLFLYYFPAIIFDCKSNIFLKPLIALKNSIYFLLRNFGISLLIFVLLFIINAIVSILKGICPILLHNYPYLMLILEVLYIFYIIYFLSFAVMLICNYYGTKYSCDNGSDGVGEDSGNDSVSEEN